MKIYNNKIIESHFLKQHYLSMYFHPLLFINKFSFQAKFFHLFHFLDFFIVICLKQFYLIPISISEILRVLQWVKSVFFQNLFCQVIFKFDLFFRHFIHHYFKKFKFQYLNFVICCHSQEFQQIPKDEMLSFPHILICKLSLSHFIDFKIVFIPIANQISFHILVGYPIF